MKKTNKSVSILLILLLMLSTILPFNTVSAATQIPDMSVSFIDCGQGDAILISSEDSHMLVDAGKESKVGNVISYLDNLGIKKLDYVIATHPDEDHIGGMPDIYSRYQVDNSIYSNFTASTKTYEEYIEAIKNEPSSNYKTADNADGWSVGDAEVDVIYDGKTADNSNDSSIVLKVTCGQRKLLLTGDISSAVEDVIISSDQSIDSDILKVAHHGSAGSSSKEFLNAVTPQVAVISVGAGNSYGHPTAAALQRISAVCSKTYRTDLHGTVVLTVENNDIKYNNSVINEPQDTISASVKTVYVTANGSKYHASDKCSNMKNPIKKTLNEAKSLGYTACSKCVGADFETQVHKHTYKTTTSKATLTKNGKIEKKCSVCGYVASTSTTIRRIDAVKLSATTYTYNGKTKRPSVTVKDSAGKTISSSNYTVTYASGCKNVGKYKVTVKFKGNYSGTKTLYFKINPVKTTVSKLTPGKKSLKVYITKKTGQVTGYQNQYSTSKTFKSSKTKTISGYKTTSAAIKSLKAKKTYYVRVRTYKTVSGAKYYSGWSAYKYTKTK